MDEVGYQRCKGLPARLFVVDLNLVFSTFSDKDSYQSILTGRFRSILADKDSSGPGTSTICR